MLSTSSIFSNHCHPQLSADLESFPSSEKPPLYELLKSSEHTPFPAENKKITSRLEVICRVVLGAFAFAGLAYVGASLKTTESKPIQCPTNSEVSAVMNGLQKSCMKIGKQIYGSSLVGSNLNYPLNQINQNFKCQLVVDCKETLHNYDENVLSKKNDYYPYIEKLNSWKGTLLNIAVQWRNAARVHNKASTDEDRAYAKNEAVNTYWSWYDGRKFSCENLKVLEMPRFQIKQYFDNKPKTCAFRECLPFSIEHSVFNPKKNKLNDFYFNVLRPNNPA